jgi:hypothetical protein
LLTDVVADVLVNLKHSLTVSGVSLQQPEIHRMIEVIEEYGTIFLEVNTQHKREMYFNKYFGMVLPRPIFLGTRLDHLADKATGCLRPVIKRETFQYVPILKLIAQLMNDSKVFDEVTSVRKFATRI